MATRKKTRSYKHANSTAVQERLPTPADPTAVTLTPRRQWPMKSLGAFALLALSALVSYLFFLNSSSEPAVQAGMVRIPGGEFLMGSPEGKSVNANELPTHRVSVSTFDLDEHEVTNTQFGEFIKATNYVTMAEKAPDWELMKTQLPPGTPKPAADVLVPGSLVFTPTTEAVPLSNAAVWWRWVPGADWRHPTGPTSNIDGLDQHPVVQVAWDDAAAYAKWAGKRLPTEAEWEYAARGGLKQKRYTWGDEPLTDTIGDRANIWQGNFPNKNLLADKFDRSAPIKQYPPNSYQLYDMAGNVWEWCSDWYAADEYARRAGTGVKNPIGPSASNDPNEPLTPKRVTRGGSFLCHESYCESYRTAARRGTATDSGMNHLGFRCAKSVNTNEK